MAQLQSLLHLERARSRLLGSSHLPRHAVQPLGLQEYQLHVELGSCRTVYCHQVRRSSDLLIANHY